MSEQKWCPSCNGELAFVGSIGVTLHEGDDAQADRYDCPSGHTVLVMDTPDAVDDEYDGSYVENHCEICGEYDSECVCDEQDEQDAQKGPGG